MDVQLITQVKQAFTKSFNIKPLLIFSPGRINIIGEHTDYNEGFVFPAAVNKGIYTAIAKSKKAYSTAIALDMNASMQFKLDTLKPEKEGSWKNYVLGVVAELQNKNKPIGNFNIVFKGDIPAGAGMSSSAALENSIVFGLNDVFNLGLSKNEMILISQKAEHNYVGVKCGIMDQYASMFGIKNSALHLDCRLVTSKPYQINFKNHQFLLINTNVKHSLSESAYNDRRLACETVSKSLNIKALRDATEADLNNVIDKISPANYDKALYVIQENDRTLKAAAAMARGDIKTLGKLMYQSHKGLSHKYNVSCKELDFLVAQAKQNKNVLGARMMGGGFGGCTINLVSKTEANQFAKNASQAFNNTFNTPCSVYHVTLSDGTQIVENV